MMDLSESNVEAGKEILKLYSPLHADFYPTPEPEEMDDDYNMESCLDADGRELTSYADLLMEAVETEEHLAETKRGLMEWFDGSPEVEQKVASVFPRLEEINGVLYGVTVCHLREALTPSELSELKGYIEGQYADGWGESFSQEARRAPDGELYLHFWKADDFSFRTAQEMAKEIKRSIAAKTKKQHKGVDR